MENWKKRVLEMVSQVMRMEHNRQTKMAIMGWREDLEEIEKYPERKLFSIGKKKLIKEAGLNWVGIEVLTGDREAWKKIVQECLNHLKEFDRLQSNHATIRTMVERWTEERILKERRNIINIERKESTQDVVDELKCKEPSCSKNVRSLSLKEA